MSNRIIFNGREYSSPDEMSAEVRRNYEASMKLFGDNDNDGMPDVSRKGYQHRHVSPATPSDTTPLFPRRLVFRIIFGVLLVLTLSLGSCPAYRYWYDHNGDADQIDDIAFVPAQGADVMLAIESIEHITSSSSRGGMTSQSSYDTYRLTSIDLGTGALIQRKIIGDDRDERIEFIGTVGGHFWLYSYDPDIGLHTRNPSTLEIVQTEKEIVAKNPLLATGLLKDPSPLEHYYGVEQKSGKIYVTLIDGHGMLIDPATLVAVPVTEKPEHRSRLSSLLGTSVDLRGGDRISVEGSPRQSIGILRRVDGHNELIPPDPSISFLNARIILDNANREQSRNAPLELSASKSIFILHDDKIGEDALPVLSRITVASGITVDWSMKLTQAAANDDGQRPELRGAGVYRESLILVVGTQAYCFDVKTGRVKWYHFF